MSEDTGSKSGNDGGDQLISFFLYSFVIYPVTNYIVSPQRSYSRWRAAAYAFIFLIGISTLHMWYENIEKGPNYYQLLRVTRSSTIGEVKKAYRNLSLELHPDKNKSPNAANQFRQVKHAFDILSNKEKRREYNRLGEYGVQIAAQAVIDHKFLLIQFIVYYASSGIFAFIMTFSEPSGESLTMSLFGLISMLLIEALLVLQEVQLPGWFLPHHTAHDVVSTMHRLFPAFMNGCRCINTAFHVERKAVRVEALEKLAVSMRDVSLKTVSVVHTLLEADGTLEDSAEVALQNGMGLTVTTSQQLLKRKSIVLSALGGARSEGEGLMRRLLRDVEFRVSSSAEGKAGVVSANMKRKHQLIMDPTKLAKAARERGNGGAAAAGGWGFPARLTFLRDVLIYLSVRFIYAKTRSHQ